MKKQRYFIVFSLFAIICLTVVIVDLLDDGNSRFFNNAGHTTDARAIETTKVDYHRFAVLTLGASYEEAQAIMHSSGRLIHTNMIGSIRQRTYSWQDKDVKVTCSFRNDKLYSKSINGIDVCNLWPDAKGIRIDKKTYVAIGDGLPYPQVAQLIGNGILVSKSVSHEGQVTELFSWENLQHERINIMFIDGKVSNKWEYGLRDAE